LEGHLDKGIRTKPVTGNKFLAISLELELLTVILTDQVANPTLCKTNAGPQLGRELPLEFLWCCINFLGFSIGRVVAIMTILSGRTMFGGLVALGVRAEWGVEEGGCGWVDGARHEHESFRKDVGGKAKDGVAVYTRMFKVDTGGSIRTDDNLELQKSNRLEC
jgi:hypothetical protein